jgi:hypothetical protein
MQRVRWEISLTLLDEEDVELKFAGCRYLQGTDWLT